MVATPLLTRVNSLKKQGKTDFEITDILTKEGYSKKDIKSFLNKSKTLISSEHAVERKIVFAIILIILLLGTLFRTGFFDPNSQFRIDEFIITILSVAFIVFLFLFRRMEYDSSGVFAQRDEVNHIQNYGLSNGGFTFRTTGRPDLTYLIVGLGGLIFAICIAAYVLVTFDDFLNDSDLLLYTFLAFILPLIASFLLAYKIPQDSPVQWLVKFTEDKITLNSFGSKGKRIEEFTSPLQELNAIYLKSYCGGRSPPQSIITFFFKDKHFSLRLHQIPDELSLFEKLLNDFLSAHEIPYDYVPGGILNTARKYIFNKEAKLPNWTYMG